MRTAKGKARQPEAALARLLGQLAKQKAAIEIHVAGADAAVTAAGGSGWRASREIIALAEQNGLIGPVCGGHRILPAGLAWLKRRLAGGDGYLEQHRQIAGREVLVDGVRQTVTVNEQESPLAWLRKRTDKAGQPILSEAQFAAGERLRADFTRGGLSPRVTAAWDGLASSGHDRRGAPGDAVHLRDGVVAARQRVREALEAAGPELAGILLDVCCHLKGLEAAEQARGWPARSGKVVLLLALSRLARHYGLSAASRPAAGRAQQITHWGDADYRPTLAAWRRPELGE